MAAVTTLKVDHFKEDFDKHPEKFREWAENVEGLVAGEHLCLYGALH